MRFTITSYNGMHKVERTDFIQATNAAHRFASVGDLPSTIVDGHGCRWTVWSGATPELVECPGETYSKERKLPVLRCDCAYVFRNDPTESETTCPNP
jgi:hypothetical protein